MSMGKIYVAGPMRGYPEFNFPMFHKVATLLREDGWEVFSPAEKDIEHHGTDISKGNKTGSIEEASANHGFSLRRALEDDTSWICRHGTAICMLPGWEASLGARAEYWLSKALGHEIIFYNPDADGEFTREQ